MALSAQRFNTNLQCADTDAALLDYLADGGSLRSGFTLLGSVSVMTRSAAVLHQSHKVPFVDFTVCAGVAVLHTHFFSPKNAKF